jgi:GMP synthase-like glutamine amidotransferase
VPLRVLAVTHGPSVRPELFGDVIGAEGHELVEWDIRTQGRPPDGFDAVFVFGGDQNVGEEVEHPWLHDEYTTLRRLVDEETPLFCVCLGAQTLAYATGGVAEPIGETIAGFVTTELTAEGAADPVLGALPPRFESFNVNGYRFTPPPGAVTLATGPVTQAYRLGARAWGTQFHPEVRRDQAVDWLRDDPTVTRPLDELVEELDEKLPAWQEHGRTLCRAFLAAAAT